MSSNVTSERQKKRTTPIILRKRTAPLQPTDHHQPPPITVNTEPNDELVIGTNGALPTMSPTPDSLSVPTIGPGSSLVTVKLKPKDDNKPSTAATAKPSPSSCTQSELNKVPSKLNIVPPVASILPPAVHAITDTAPQQMPILYTTKRALQEQSGTAESSPAERSISHQVLIKKHKFQKQPTYSSNPAELTDDDDDNGDGNCNDGNDNYEIGGNSHKLVRNIRLHCPLPDCKAHIPYPTNANFKKTGILIDTHTLSAHGFRMPHICLACRRKYTAGELDKHFAEHHLPSAGPFKCPKCGQGNFKTYDSLAGHNYAAHMEGCFGCTVPKCSFTAPFRADVYRHSHDVHRQFKCSFEGCTEAFKYPSELKRHNWDKHLGLAQFRCTWPGCRWPGRNTRAKVVIHVKKHINQLGRGSHEPSQYIRMVTLTDAMREAGMFDFEIE